MYVALDQSCYQLQRLTVCYSVRLFIREILDQLDRLGLKEIVVARLVQTNKPRSFSVIGLRKITES